MAVGVGGLLVGAGATGGVAADTDATAAWVPAADDKVDVQVLEALDERGRAEFWVRFEARPDLASLAGIEDWSQRGQAVHQALTSTAEDSQARVRAELEVDGIAYDAYFISNAIHVPAGDESLVSSLVARPEVEGIYPSVDYELPDPVESDPIFVPSVVEWGVADINADDVWSGFGVQGEGIVVANIDTGVQFDHPALVEQYRGNDGDGSFIHDYNWFDASGVGSDEPVDFEAHGTHTMGTMVGGDGGSNQIGVAPGAKWIAANGCCPSDEALIASGEWMLAPTDLAGENADPDQRPHVVNNSWGSGIPSNDPFMEDVSEAWAAAGIFGMWANGNSGPACETSGSPGSRIINYSAGNYDINHEINSSSGRGPGQDGETKPNISAPGTDVRSSVPGNGYEAFTGTSMAAPHTAGAVALLWSAAPDLIGDIELTKEMLDDSAVDSPDEQCGGTDDDNNVFGEGRLDALALLQAAPIGDVGTLEGTVTEAGSGVPVAGATVTLTGERERSVRTDAEGAFRVRVSSGDHTVTVAKFGYVTDTGTITVPVDDTVTYDVVLQRAPMGTVTGTVTDGSGQGWPLYARISVAGQSVGGYTDPETGRYALDLPAGTHTLVATVQYPGYLVERREVTVLADGSIVENFALTVDSISCTAPGYAVVSDGVTQTFDDTSVPPGWSVEDLVGTGQVWTFEDPYEIPNLTGGEGNFAVVNSDFYGPEGEQDTVLVSPPLDLSGLTSPVVAFQHHYDAGGGSRASVEASADGGATWVTVWDRTVFDDGAELVELGEVVAGAEEVQLRFRYQASFDRWWQVDDVFLGNRVCAPTGGGLLVGYVQDEAGTGLVGARVTSVDRPTDSGQTRATPDDPALDDGFYWLHSGLEGTHPFRAAVRNYGTHVQGADIATNDVVRADFVLTAARLEVDPTSIQTSVRLGESAGGDFTVTNTGTSAAEVSFSEIPGDFVVLRADGSTMSRQAIEDAEGAPVVRHDVQPSLAAVGASTARASEPQAPPRATDVPWIDLSPLPSAVMDNRLVSLNAQWYSIGGSDGFAGLSEVWRYDSEAMAWQPVAPLPEATQQAAAAVLDGRIVVAGGWDSTGTATDATWIYDPQANEWSPGSPMPTAVSAPGQAVLDGRLYAVGGCTTGECFPIVDTVQVYDLDADAWSEGTGLPEATTFSACGGMDGALICTGGVGEAGEGLATTLLYDPGSGTWDPLPDAPAATWGASYAAVNGMLVVNGGIQDNALTNRTFAYNPAEGGWVDLPASNQAVYRGGGACGFARAGGDTGGFLPTAHAELLPGLDICDESTADVPWLELDTTEAVLEPGQSVTVQVSTHSAAVAQPGTYTAQVGVNANVPERPDRVEVAMTVTPPLSWGKLEGTAYLQACDGGAVAGDSITIDIKPTRDGVGTGWVVSTNHEGYYARWINTQIGELRVTATLPGFRPDTALVELVRGGITTQDLYLLNAGCEDNPTPVPPQVVRLDGVDRYDTAARVSALFPPPAGTVFVATGENYPDALAAAARAGSLGGPVLLTHPDELPQVTRIQLARLRPDTVILVGGTAAVSGPVEDELRAAAPGATVTRFAGKDRYETAGLIAQDFATAEVVYVATGRNFPDALAGAARAGALDAPVLLVTPDAVPAATARQLDRLDPERIVLLGGTGAVSTQVEEELEGYGSVQRVAGADRYGTAALIAQDYETSHDAFVATGGDWPDALAGAARSGHVEAPMLLVKTSAIPPVTWDELERLDPGRVFVLGGEAAVGPEVVDRLLTLQ